MMPTKTRKRVSHGSILGCAPHAPLLCVLFAVAGATGCASGARDRACVPAIEGPWWTIAHDPDLGPLTDPGQQPVDFAIWQAADGTWQLWSCIRGTRCGGKTRLLHRWEGRRLTDADWKPMGVAMQADPNFGETPGGLQAPHVVKVGGGYFMAYGDWENICLATSTDGKHFERRRNPDGKTGIFSEGPGVNTRDPMLIRIHDRWHCYYTAHPDRHGAVYCRTSPDLLSWTASRIAAYGGQAGDEPYAAECPHVVARSGWFYLFRTQRYGTDMQTSVYRSRDPMDFGVNDDRCLIGTMPVAAPEIITVGDRHYIASLLPSLKGIQIARLKWTPDTPTESSPRR